MEFTLADLEHVEKQHENHGYCTVSRLCSAYRCLLHENADLKGKLATIQKTPDSFDGETDSDGKGE